MAEPTVLVRRRALGDVVLLGAVTAALPGPVTVVTDARYLEVAGRLRGVERVVVFGEGRPEGRVVDLQRDLRTLAAFPRATRLHKGSVARRSRAWGLGPGRASVVELYGRACGVVPRPPPWIDGGAAVRDGLVLVAGASTPEKALAPALLIAAGRAHAGPVTVLGGPGDEAAVAEVAAAVPGAAALVERGFRRTLALLLGCRVALGGDTGLMHLAAAAGARTVVGLGPTHEDDGFWPHADVVLGLALPCRPCTLHRPAPCRMARRYCKELPVSAVIDAVDRCASSS